MISKHRLANLRDGCLAGNPPDLVFPFFRATATGDKMTLDEVEKIQI